MRALRLTLLSLILASSAAAQPASEEPAPTPITCDEVLNMVAIAVPESIVVDTIKGRSEPFTPQDVECLKTGGASEAVVRAASGEKPKAEPTPEPTPKAPEGELTEAERMEMELEAFMLLDGGALPDAEPTPEPDKKAKD